jgi:hypothetical protein
MASVPTSRWSMMQELDGVLNRNNVAGAGGINIVDHGGQSGALAGPGDAGRQDQSPPLVGDFVENSGQMKIFEGVNGLGNHAKGNGDRSTLAEDIHPEAAQPGNAVSKIHLEG